MSVKLQDHLLTAKAVRQGKVPPFHVRFRDRHLGVSKLVIVGLRLAHVPEFVTPPLLREEAGDESTWL